MVGVVKLMLGLLLAAGAPPLKGDAHTVALWRCDAMRDGVVEDHSGNGHAAQLSKNAEIVDGALLIDNDGVMSALGAAAPIGKGPFTVEIDMQVLRTSGYFFAAGERRLLLWGFLLRGAGNMALHVPIKTAAGENDWHRDETFQFQKPIGPVRHDTVYRYTLVFDGDRTLTAYVDGEPVFTTQLPEGATIDIDKPTAKFGQPQRWKSNFDGRIFAARISDAARTPDKPARFLPTSMSETRGFFGFDMGMADSPVETGFLQVTPLTIYPSGGGFGWLNEPTEAVDYWFSAGRYTGDPERTLAQHSEAVRSWRDRDALRVPSGSTFRADLPPGTYAVSVTFGDLRQNTRVQLVEVNGKVISDDLRMYKGKDNPTFTMTIGEGRGAGINRTDRTARGIVDVGADGLHVKVTGVKDEPVGVLAIEAHPWSPPVIGKIDGERQLKWQGDGAAPQGFDAFAAAYADKRFDEAVKRAHSIEDPLAQATAVAWVVGYPNSTDARHVAWTQRVIDLLEGLDDPRAASLLETARLMYTVLRIQVDDTQGVDDLVGSTNWRHLRTGAGMALRITRREPFFGRARLLAGSFIYQQVQQSGAMIDDWTFRKPERAVGWPPPVVYFLDTIAVYPDSTLTRIYLGEKVPLEKTIAIPKGAPQWAALQHRATVRAMDVIHYWTDERQEPGGALGGGIGDDVETLRWWSIGDMVTDDERTRVGWRKIADAAYRYTRGNGYTTSFADVEHGAEPFSDTHTFLPFVDFGTDRFESSLNRAYKGLFTQMRDIWTAVNPQGYRMFRSYYYSASEVNDRNGDVPYNLRTANPLLTYAWFTRDEEVAALLVDWAKSWRDAILAEGEGKPAGIVPMIVTFDKRQFKWDHSKTWYDPGYYNYPAGYASNIPNLLLAAYELSGDESFLEPIRQSLTLLRDVEPPTNVDPDAHYYRLTDQALAEQEMEKGSLRWALWFGQRQIAMAGARYRIVTGDTQFDDVLLKFGPATTRARLAFKLATTDAERRAAMEPIHEEFTEILDHMDYNIELRTSEPKSTDRVWVGGTEQVIAMATGTATTGGARGAERQWPLFAVTWKNTGVEVSPWMIDNSRDRVAGYLYSFADQPRTLGAQVWRLEPGVYTVTVSASDGFAVGAALTTRDVTIENRGDVVEFDAPARQEIFFEIKRK